MLDKIKEFLDSKGGKAGLAALVLFGGMFLGQTNLAFDIYEGVTGEDPRAEICEPYLND